MHRRPRSIKMNEGWTHSSLHKSKLIEKTRINRYTDICWHEVRSTVSQQSEATVICNWEGNISSERYTRDIMKIVCNNKGFQVSFLLRRQHNWWIARGFARLDTCRNICSIKKSSISSPPNLPTLKKKKSEIDRDERWTVIKPISWNGDSPFIIRLKNSQFYHRFENWLKISNKITSSDYLLKLHVEQYRSIIRDYYCVSNDKL